MTGLSAYESAACEAARRAGEGLLRRFGRTDALRVDEKARHDFVTDADREAEETLVSYLRNRFPDHGFVAEESAGPDPVGRLGEDGATHRWLIDPLDGTTNFIHEIPTFAVSIALEDAEGLAAAVIHDPVHDETFHATRGGGARLDGRPIRCSDAERLDGTLVATGIPFHDLDPLPGYVRALEACTRSSCRLRRAGAAAVDLAYAACGRYDGFWEVGLRPWDLAAGALLVREAGGLVTDVSGADDYLLSGSIVAAGPAVHRALLEIVRNAGLG